MKGSAAWISAVPLPAAVYNVLSGGLAVLFPLAVFRPVGMELPNYPQTWQRVDTSVGHAVAASTRCACDV
jgi:hypothetical protein